MIRFLLLIWIWAFCWTIRLENQELKLQIHRLQKSVELLSYPAHMIEPAISGIEDDQIYSEDE
jgi:hypothetical protein